MYSDSGHNTNAYEQWDQYPWMAVTITPYLQNMNACAQILNPLNWFMFNKRVHSFVKIIYFHC